MENRPLIVTLKLDEEAQSYFSRMRQQHYPGHSNFTDAHVTLFHTLPAGNSEVMQVLEASAERFRVCLTVTGLKFTGHGVSFSITSPELSQMHVHLQESFKGMLTGKDSQLLEPHVTVQNKVTAYRAAKLYENLLAGFSPFTCMGIGISTFIYNKGPWIHTGDFLFENFREGII